MKVLLGVTIVLLALVSLGLVVYTYTKHREVTYLTLRADYLEDRIIALESAPSVINGTGEDEEIVVEAPTSGLTSRPTHTISLNDHEDTTSTPSRSLEELNHVRQEVFGLEPLTLEEANKLRQERGLPPFRSESTLAPPQPTPDPLLQRIRREQMAQDLKAEVPGMARLLAPNANPGYLNAS